MIAGIFHQGSGLGNQLHRYIATRVLALDKGWDWMMWFRPDESGKREGFKGDFFLNQPEWQTTGTMINEWKWWEEKRVNERGVDIRSYDPEINFVEDNTIIDGEFQDPRYFMHRIDEIKDWLKTESLEIDDDVCVIGFRGGEFAVFPDLFLTKEYWDEGISKMRAINPDMKFEVHTDDPVLAKEFFPDFPIIQDIGINWRSMRYAKYAIIANSSFYILPRLLSDGITIAPRFWARRNTGVWALPSNYYPQFTYI